MTQWNQFRQLATVTGLTLALLGASTLAMAQRTGDSARVTVGIVEGKQRINLKSDTGRNSLIGGALGWGLARNKSSATQAAAALGGAAIGGGATSAAQGDNTAIQYTVRTSAGSAIQVVTDQTEIIVGDCVIVEETSKGANVRRKDPAMCKTASQEVMSHVEPELKDDASQCDAAKQRLFDAKTTEEVAVAKQVMEILCND
jgi:S1-C subfamily serine protease